MIFFSKYVKMSILEKIYCGVTNQVKAWSINERCSINEDIISILFVRIISQFKTKFSTSNVSNYNKKMHDKKKMS